MTTEATETQENTRSRKVRTLLFLLVASCLVMASLICCGQVALLLGSSSRTVDTLSMLKADYGPWGYEKVGAINLAGFKEDLQQDQEREGVVVQVPGDDIVPGVFWPTGIPTPIPVAALSGTPTVNFTEIYPLESETVTLTARPSTTPSPTISGGMGTATRTATGTKPVSSVTPTRTASATMAPTATRTNTYVPLPTWTFTAEPEEPSNTPPATATFTAVPPTRTFTPVPTSTSTHTPIVVPPTFTFTPVPTNTPETPVYLLYPKAENEGISDPDLANPAGCMGFFGYVNTNPQAIDIAPGSDNFLSPNAYEVNLGDPYFSSGLPTSFYTGSWSGIVQVKWDTGTPITWTLNGESATLGWCR